MTSTVQGFERYMSKACPGRADSSGHVTFRVWIVTCQRHAPGRRRGGRVDPFDMSRSGF